MTLTTAAPAIAGEALRRLWQGDLAGAETMLRLLTTEELRQAHTVALRVAVLADTIRFEGLAETVAARLVEAVAG